MARQRVARQRGVVCLAALAGPTLTGATPTIVGLGPIRQATLLEAFGSVEQLRLATVEQVREGLR